MAKALGQQNIDEVFEMSRGCFLREGKTLPTTLGYYTTTTTTNKAEQNAVEETDGATQQRRADSDEHILVPKITLQVPEKSRFADDDEIDLDVIEAGMAAAEAEEARREEEYQKKKAAEREAQRKKEEDEIAAYEANMKEAERKAEELEAAHEKERVGDPSDEANKTIFAALINDKDGAIDLESDDNGESMMKGATSRPSPVGVHASNPQQSSAESPRSRRRKMLDTELTESLRNNLLWERQTTELIKVGEGARDSRRAQDPSRTDDGTVHHEDWEWESQRDNFTKCYKTETKTLQEFARYMSEHHDFHATPRQWERKVRDWGLEKYTSRQDQLERLEGRSIREAAGAGTKTDGGPAYGSLNQKTSREYFEPAVRVAGRATSQATTNFPDAKPKSPAATVTNAQLQMGGYGAKEDPATYLASNEERTKLFVG